MPSPPASGTDGAPRYLIASGTQSYIDPDDRLERVPDELRRITELFREYGFAETLTDLRLDPAAQDFKAGLEDWLTDGARDPEGAAVVYYTGHGFTTPGGHYLAFRDTVIGKAAGAVETGELVTLVGPTPRVRRLLIIIDACESGGGLLDAVQRAARAAIWQLPWQWREGIWVIAATRPKEKAAQSAFVSAFVHAVRQAAETTGAEQEFLAIEVILDNVNKQLKGSGQLATAAPASYGTGLLPIFRNPAYLRRTHSGRLRTEEIFTGRVRALAELRAWLSGTDMRPRLVTGDPGSGKSALLAQVIAGTERALSVSALKRTSQGLAADLIAAAAQLGAPTSEPTASLPDDTLIVVDGLDESAQPYEIMAEVLAPLAAASLRLLIASRRPYDRRLPFAAEIIDLDKPTYYERADVRDYAARLLVSPVIDPATAERVAAVIAEWADRSFLLARGATLAVRNTGRPVSSGEVAELIAGWEGVGAAFDADLEQRLGSAAARARELLAPLAWSYGQGLPWENIWADAATALSTGTSYGDADVRWVLDNAHSYLWESADQGRSVYRVFHAELARHLRGELDPREVNRRLAEVLIGHVPTHHGRREWQAAHPYVCGHLAEHGAVGGMLDDLVIDPGFLLAAAGPGLTRSVRSLKTPAGRAAASAYLRVADRLGRPENIAESAAYLEFAASQYGDEGLTVAAGWWAAGSPWRARWTRWNRPHASRILARNGPVRGLAWLRGSDDPLVAIATGDRRDYPDPRPGSSRVSVHDFWTGETVFAAQLDESVWSLNSAVVGGEALLLAGDSKGCLHVWRVADWELIWVLHAHDRNLQAAWAGDVDGRQILITCGRSAADNKNGPSEVTVWDPRSWTATLGPIRTFDGHVSHLDVLFLDHPAVLVSGDPVYEPSETATTVRAFDLETGEQRLALPTSRSILASAISLPRSPGRFVRSTDGTVELWDAAGPRCLHSTQTKRLFYGDAVATVATDQGDLLVVPRGEEIELYELETLRLVATMHGHGFWVKYLAVGEVDGRAVVLSAAENEVRVWDLTDALPRNFGQPGQPANAQGVTAISCLPGRVLVARGDGRLADLDLTAGSEQQVWEMVPDRIIRQLVITPAGYGHTARALAIVAGSLLVSDLATPEALRALNRGYKAIRLSGVASTVVGDRLVIGACGENATVVLYDGETERPIGVPLSEEYWDDKELYVVAFTAAEPRLVLAAGSNRHVAAWDLRQALAGHAIEVSLPELHDDHVRAIAVFGHPLGELIVSAGDDRRVVVIDPASGRNWRQDEAHADWIMAVAVLPAGLPIIATGSRDGYVGLWTLSERGLEQLAMIAVGAPVADLCAAGPDLLVVATPSGVSALDVASP